MAHNGHALPKCRKSVILQLGSGVTFFIYAALLKYNRNSKVEMMYSLSPAFWQCNVGSSSVIQFFEWSNNQSHAQA